MPSFAAPASLGAARKHLRTLFETKSHQCILKEVVTILREWPALAREPFSYLREGTTFSALPFAYLLAARAPLAILQEVYEVYPKATECHCDIINPNASTTVTSHQRLLPLHLAVKSGCGVDMLGFLVAQDPTALYESIRNHQWTPLKETLPVHCLLGVGCGNNNDAATAATAGDDHYSKIRLLIGKDPNDDMQLLLANHLPSLLLKNSAEVPDDFIQWVAKSLSETRAKLDGVAVDETTLPNLVHFLTSLQVDGGVFELTFENCTFHAESLQVLLQSNLPPLTLAFEGLVLQGCTTAPPSWSRCCPIHKVELANCPQLTEQNLSWLLQGILQQPHLAALVLTSMPFDCTHLVQMVLKQGKQLERLRVKRTPLNVDKIATFLQDNPAAVAYLEYIPHSRRPHTKLQYYSSLNRCGKSRMIEPNLATPKTLVHALTKLQEDAVIPKSTLLHLSLHYGLLRELPSLWSQ